MERVNRKKGWEKKERGGGAQRETGKKKKEGRMRENKRR